MLFIAPGINWLAECTGIYFETFLQEDLAIVTGGLLVVKNELPLLVVAFTLFSGILTGDVIIYGLGYAARHIPWFHRKLFSPKVESARKKIEGNIISTVALVRLMPGFLFPTYLACGMIGVSFIQFFLTTLATALVYTSALLALVIKLGDTVIPVVGFWGWIIVISFMLLLITLKTIGPKRLKLAINNGVESFEFEEMQQETTLQGMPALGKMNHKVSVSEKIPQFIFYSPLGIRWILLGLRYRNFMLPTIANPHIEAGGLWGESKSRLMQQVSGSCQLWISPFTTVTLDKKFRPEEWLSVALKNLQDSDIKFPFVAKPDIGWQGYGVRIMNNQKELLDYFRTFPLNNTVIMQKIIPFEGEAGVFYSRMPGEKHGKVTSLTLRYFPHIIGNGRNTVWDLICQDERMNFKSRYYLGKDHLHSGVSTESLTTIPEEGEIVQLAFIGSIRVGGLYKNGEKFITDELNKRFDDIACSMPEFYFGRFDIKFKSIELLMQSIDFQIFEINGAGAEAIHVWDNETPLLKSYRELFKYQSLLFKISHKNRKRGYKPMKMKEFYTFTKQYNNLISAYPPSE